MALFICLAPDCFYVYADFLDVLDLNFWQQAFYQFTVTLQAGLPILASVGLYLMVYDV